METLSREDIKAIIGNPSVEDYEVRKIILEELKLKIPDNMSRTEMVDFVYEEYQKALKNIEEKKSEALKSNPVVKKSKVKKSSNGKITKKEFIINLVKEGCYTRKQLIEKVDDHYGYTLKNKTSKVRVSKVLKELHVNLLLELNPAGLLIYKGGE
tara:strand:- start:21501 stop:21965 length:465 start_codon:yes stop_codon:yes gene_type:complete